MNEFDCSGESIRKANRFIFMLWLSSIPMLFLFALIALRVSMSEAALLTAATALASAATNLWIIRREDRKNRRRKLSLCEDRIILSRLDKEERALMFEEIARIRVVENPKGNIESITLCGNEKGKKRRLRIYGFNKMGEILELIGEKVPNRALVETKHQLFDAHNPLFAVAMAMITFVLILSCIYLARALGLLD
ncbi:MAG TPA: hypothetical protein VMX13_03855 [Sedimentisphaerales bacterium]|nr:hypothetical protein [Sedimentisphaerales bacterium]